MKFKETIEYFIIVELAIMVVAVYLVLGGGFIDTTQTLEILQTVLLILIVGTQSLTAIILLRLFKK
jgi:hypothetical protein